MTASDDTATINSDTTLVKSNPSSTASPCRTTRLEAAKEYRKLQAEADQAAHEAAQSKVLFFPSPEAKAKHAAARSNATRLQKAAAEAKAVADEMWKRERETRLVDGEEKASRGGLASTIYFESVS